MREQEQEIQIFKYPGQLVSRFSSYVNVEPILEVPVQVPEWDKQR